MHVNGFHESPVVFLILILILIHINVIVIVIVIVVIIIIIIMIIIIIIIFFFFFIIVIIVILILIIILVRVIITITIVIASQKGKPVSSQMLQRGDAQFSALLAGLLWPQSSLSERPLLLPEPRHCSRNLCLANRAALLGTTR